MATSQPSSSHDQTNPPSTAGFYHSHPATYDSGPPTKLRRIQAEESHVSAGDIDLNEEIDIKDFDLISSEIQTRLYKAEDDFVDHIAEVNMTDLKQEANSTTQFDPLNTKSISLVSEESDYTEPIESSDNQRNRGHNVGVTRKNKKKCVKDDGLYRCCIVDCKMAFKCSAPTAMKQHLFQSHFIEGLRERYQVIKSSNQDSLESNECPVKDCGYIGGGPSNVLQHLAWVHRGSEKPLMSYIQEHGLEGSKDAQRLLFAVRCGYREDSPKQKCNMCERMCNPKYLDIHKLFYHLKAAYMDEIKKGQEKYNLKYNQCPFPSCTTTSPSRPKLIFHYHSKHRLSEFEDSSSEQEQDIKNPQTLNRDTRPINGDLDRFNEEIDIKVLIFRHISTKLKMIFLTTMKRLIGEALTWTSNKRQQAAHK